MPYIKTEPQIAILEDPKTGDYIIFSWDAARAIDTTEQVSLRFVSASGNVINEWGLVRKIARELWAQLTNTRGWTRKS